MPASPSPEASGRRLVLSDIALDHRDGDGRVFRALDIPTLVLAGEYDLQTPPEWGELAASGLSNSYLIEFPNTGHGVIFYSSCAQDIFQAFIDQPTMEPDSTCTQDLTTVFETDP